MLIIDIPYYRGDREGGICMKTYVTTVSVDNFELRYYKTTTQGEDGGSIFYGVFVEKFADDKLVEEMDSDPLTENEARIDEVINKLAEGSVTPFDLPATLDHYEEFQLQQDNIPA